MGGCAPPIPPRGATPRNPTAWGALLARGATPGTPGMGALPTRGATPRNPPAWGLCWPGGRPPDPPAWGLCRPGGRPPDPRHGGLPPPYPPGEADLPRRPRGGPTPVIPGRALKSAGGKRA